MREQTHSMNRYDIFRERLIVIFKLTAQSTHYKNRWKNLMEMKGTRNMYMLRELWLKVIKPEVIVIHI